MLILCDLDGTLTDSDVLDHLADSYGKTEEKKALNQAIQIKHIKGAEILRRRIALLEGLSISEIRSFLVQKAILRDGWENFAKFINERQLQLVLLSGNIQPVLEYYGQLLGASCIVATEINVSEDKIVNMKAIHKTAEYICTRFTNSQLTNAIAIGDDQYDIPFFKLARYSIAFNAKSDIKQAATISGNGDCNELLRIVKPFCNLC